MYIKKGINFHQRNDLDVYKSKELDSIFIEIINQKVTMYRHLCMDQSDFMKPLCDKLTAENKKVYLAGAFNFDLSNTQYSRIFFSSCKRTKFLRYLPARYLPYFPALYDQIILN